MKPAEVICVEVRAEVRGTASMNKAQGQSVPQAGPGLRLSGKRAGRAGPYALAGYTFAS